MSGRRTILVAALLLSSMSAFEAHADPPASGDIAHDAGLQWGLERIGAEHAWTVSRGAGVTIAIVDSGVALDHEDLEGNLVPGVRCINTGGNPENCEGSPADDDGHGTHVSGTAAAVAGNELGIAGVAPQASILPVKVLQRLCSTCESTGNALDVNAAIRWATDHGADVINLSLGSTTADVFDSGFEAALRYAWDNGAIPVVAAGNDLVLTADLGDASAVVVAATDRNDELPTYSLGVGTARWGVTAPGGDGADTSESCSQDGDPVGILSTYWAPDDPASAYACLSGTSMAAPHVSGALAILVATGLSPSMAVERLLSTATDLGAPGRDARYGSGLIDVATAVGTDAPTPSTATTIDGTPDGGQDPAVGPVSAEPARQRFESTAPRRASPGLILAAALAIAATGAGNSVFFLRYRRRARPFTGR